MEVERIDGKAIDVGMYRHYIDPVKPFATSVRPHLHGMAVTSATLRDDSEDWTAAKTENGGGLPVARPASCILQLAVRLSQLRRKFSLSMTYAKMTWRKSRVPMPPCSKH